MLLLNALRSSFLFLHRHIIPDRRSSGRVRSGKIAVNKMPCETCSLWMWRRRTYSLLFFYCSTLHIIILFYWGRLRSDAIAQRNVFGCDKKIHYDLSVLLNRNINASCLGVECDAMDTKLSLFSATQCSLFALMLEHTWKLRGNSSSPESYLCVNCDRWWCRWRLMRI